jgi:HAD superfamily hydrolase (TIGR01549 family)
MIKAVIFDFSNVLFFYRESNFQGSINGKHQELKKNSLYNIFDHFELNQELLDFANTIKSKCDLYIFTTGTVQQEPKILETINPIFKRIFTVEEIGFYKEDPLAFKEICRLINIPSKNILFIDDTLENIEAAKNAGLNAIPYLSNDQILQEIKKYIHD